MTRLRSLLRSAREDDVVTHYESGLTLESRSMPGVRYTVARMSFGRRIELGRRVRELSKRLDFHEAGNDIQDRIETGILASEIERVYLEWGLLKVEGLTIDSEPATGSSIAERGPEGLAREIAAAIRQQCGLTEDERKN